MEEADEVREVPAPFVQPETVRVARLARVGARLLRHAREHVRGVGPQALDEGRVEIGLGQPEAWILEASHLQAADTERERFALGFVEECALDFAARADRTAVDAVGRRDERSSPAQAAAQVNALKQELATLRRLLVRS